MLKPQRQRSTVSVGNRIPRGFSLIEILVVLMIIGILTALVVSALGPLLGNAKAAATQTTIEQVGSVIQARYEAVLNADVSVEAKKLVVLNRPNLDQEDAEYLIRMTLYRQALPQCPEDMFGMDLTRSTTGDNAPYAGLWNGTNNSDDSAVTASEVFLLALTEGSSVRALPGGKSYPVPLLELDSITQAHIINSDNDNYTNAAGVSLPLNELVDEWGQPFRFYNFPTGLITVSGGTFDISDAKLLISGLQDSNLTSTGPIAKDPFDSVGTHFNHLRGEFTSDPTPMEYRTGGGTTTTPIAIMSGSAGIDNYYHANRTFTPLLVSSGADLALGLNEPTDDGGGGMIDANRLAVVTSTADLTDNLTNRQQ